MDKGHLRLPPVGLLGPGRVREYGREQQIRPIRVAGAKEQPPHLERVRHPGARADPLGHPEGVEPAPEAHVRIPLPLADLDHQRQVLLPPLLLSVEVEKHPGGGAVVVSPPLPGRRPPIRGPSLDARVRNRSLPARSAKACPPW